MSVMNTKWDLNQFHGEIQRKSLLRQDLNIRFQLCDFQIWIHNSLFLLNKTKNKLWDFVLEHALTEQITDIKMTAIYIWALIA